MVFFVTLIPFYPIFRYHLSKKSRWASCYPWQVRWGNVVRFLSGIKLKIEGIENLPKPPYIVISNHASYIDTFLMYGIIPDFFVFMGMAELRKFPMFGRFFSSGQNIAVNRSSITESIKAFHLANERLKSGYSVALFPEGGIMKQVPQLSPFKNGAFKLAINQQVPIVPIIMFDTHVLLESNDVLKTIGRPGIAPVKIMEPIKTIDLKQEDLIPLRDQIHNMMSRELNRYYEGINGSI